MPSCLASWQRPWLALLPLAWAPAAAAVADCQQAGGDAVALLQTRLTPLEEEPRDESAPVPELSQEPNKTSYRQPLVNFGDAQYIAYMTLGRQAIAGILDTGSFELVVFGADCRSCGPAAHYNAHLSRTYREMGTSMEQNYGSGRLISAPGRDHLRIGSFDVQNQSFWYVRYAQMPILNSAVFEAILGLGPPEGPMEDAWEAADQAVSKVMADYDQGMLAAPDNLVKDAQTRTVLANELSTAPPPLHTLGLKRFSVCLGARPGSDGVFVWNDSLALERPELFAKVPVVSNHTWSAPVDNAHLAFPNGTTGSGGPATDSCPGGCRALVDSGTSLLAVPSPIAQGLRKAMEHLDENCSNLNILPDISFELGGTRVWLPPDSYVALVVGVQPPYVQQMAPHLAIDGGRRCHLAILETSANSTSGPLWILGMPFFRRYYTSFDLGETRDQRSLYIAPHTQDDCAPSTEGAARASLAASGHQLRSVSAAKLRLPETAQAAINY